MALQGDLSVTVYCLCVGQSLLMPFFFFFPSSLCGQESFYPGLRLFYLGTVFYLQCILKDLFFGMDLGGIVVTDVFV